MIIEGYTVYLEKTLKALLEHRGARNAWETQNTNRPCIAAATFPLRVTTCVCVYVCMYVCMHVYVYVYVCACMYVCMCDINFMTVNPRDTIYASAMHMYVLYVCMHVCIHDHDESHNHAQMMYVYHACM